MESLDSKQIVGMIIHLNDVGVNSAHITEGARLIEQYAKDKMLHMEIGGYLFEGKYYAKIEDLSGFTMSEDNHVTPLYKL